MNQNVKAILAKNIKMLRSKKNISQEALSLELDFDVSYIGKVENQKMNISLNRLIDIANFFEVNVTDLLK